MKILANDGISTSGETLLIEAGHEILNHRVSQEHLVQFINENQVEILLVKNATSIDHQVIDSCKSLKIIGKAGTEMNNVPVDYAIEKGLYVISTPNSYARATAELVFAHFFSLARFLHDSNRMMPLEGDSKFNLLKKTYQNAAELFGKTLGVIGSGSNALEVIKMGISLGMNVIIFNENSKSEKVNLDFFDGQKLVFELKSVKFEEILEKTIMEFIKTGTKINSKVYYLYGSDSKDLDEPLLQHRVLSGATSEKKIVIWHLSHFLLEFEEDKKYVMQNEIRRLSNELYRPRLQTVKEKLQGSVSGADKKELEKQEKLLSEAVKTLEAWKVVN